MVLKNIYLAGVIVMGLMIIFMKWLRMDKKETIVSLCLITTSWFAVAIVLSVIYKDWKIRRDITRNLIKK